MSKKNEPYDPNLPDMPPLIDNVILPSKTNPEAEELAKAAKEIGFNDDRADIDRLFEGPITPDEK